jgi:glycosyltransferase involved in cell wall biosynthesis
MEAMAYGLPIVASPNSGTVIREGIDGLIRPYDDIDGLCACVEKLAADKSLRLEMGRQARLHAESITIGRYGRELIKVIEADLASR